MLLLRRARLVNWHFFTDETIEIGPMTLLAGDNGSGKSTIIDALQYALVLNISKVRFNAAASDNRTSRNLAGYCRCRIGSDTLDFLRDDTITHVMLEFEDVEKSFCAGVMVEAFKDSETREHQWILEDGRITDIPIYYNGEFLPPRTFKDHVKEIGGTICSTKREYNSRLTHLLKVHRRNVHFNPYLEALVRSVNFTPFTSVNDFVCTYILEERQVDISAMRENLANYKAAEREALEMEQKIEALSEIDEVRQECASLENQIVFQEYFIRRLDVERVGIRKRDTLTKVEETRRNITRVEETLESLAQRKSGLEETRQELQFSLATDETYRTYERLHRDLDSRKNTLAREQERLERFETLIDQSETALGRTIGDDIYAESREVDREREQAAARIAEHKLAIEEHKSTLADLKTEQHDLERGILRYPQSTVELKSALDGAGISAGVFADYLEVIDSEWQNAVEGWLNTQRFNILVPEDEFQKALEIYNNQPKSIAGVGLPNLKKMHGSEIVHGSLAEVVEASTPLARRYVSYLLGNVIRADIETLKTYSKAITRECMRYSRHTASRIKEEIYSRWYIGKEAKRKRLEELAELIREITDSLDAHIGKVKEDTDRSELLSRVYATLYECTNLSGARDEVKRLSDEIAETQDRLESLDTASFEEIKVQIADITGTIRNVEKEIEDNNRRLGSSQNSHEHLTAELERIKSEEEQVAAVLEEFLREHEELREKFEGYYRERMRKERAQEEHRYVDLMQRYESAIKGLRTRLEKSTSRLTELKNSFNHTFTIYLSTAYDSDDFSRTLRKYKETELPEYKERIRRAREEAEKQFREHFVSRLNEYITDAKESFKEINHTLGMIYFGQDQYRFSIEERPEKRKILDVIQSAAEIQEYEGTLFEALASDEQRESIEALFQSILDNDLDSEEVRDICDYRQYYQYDIRIKHTQTLDRETGKPLESSLTRVLREKSGGETQTPYYVAIAASFFRFYKDEPGAVRLVLFDEAFNKMDDERIGKMVTFFKQLNMQIITAVPTEKIESIAPHMDYTNLVLRKDYTAFIRDYEVLEEDETDEVTVG